MSLGTTEKKRPCMGNLLTAQAIENSAETKMSIPIPDVQEGKLPGGTISLEKMTRPGFYTVIVTSRGSTTRATFRAKSAATGEGVITVVDRDGPGTISLVWTSNQSPTLSASGDTPANTFHIVMVRM